MFEIYEGRGPDRKLVRQIKGETIEIRDVDGFLIWLELLAESKVILSLFVSPHQLGRLGKYLTDGKWPGGVICLRTQPDGCYIRELDDQARYRQVLKDIEYHRSKIQDYEGKTCCEYEYHRRELSNLEIEALMLKDSTRFGLVFVFSQRHPI